MNRHGERCYKGPLALALVLIVLLASAIGMRCTGEGSCVNVRDTGPQGETLNVSDAPTVTFAVIGDYGDGGAQEGAVAMLVNSLAPDLVITTGDNDYSGGSAQSLDKSIGRFYHSYIYPYGGAYGDAAGDAAALNRFYPTLGNHDWPSGGYPEAYLDYFDLPGNGRYYDFTWGPVHFFALSTYRCEPGGVDRDSKQARWLKDRLAASRRPFKVVYGHHPPYSSGRHGSIGYMRWPLSAWGADAYLAGHDHSYERLMVGGMPYFVVGNGGRSLYDFEDILPESVVRYNRGYGAMLVRVEAHRAHFAFYALDGSVIDEYEVLR